jgi:hypothetical protein
MRKNYCCNLYRCSTVSNLANSAFMIVLPDASTLLTVKTTVTTATSIGISWSNGLSNSGSRIIDFTISFD